MQLSAQAIKEFQSIYLAEFGKTISYDKAKSEGLKLLNLFKTLYRPIEAKKCTISAPKRNHL